MAMSKGFRVLEKSKPPAPHSILLEHRNRTETLLFESQVIAVLSAHETEVIRKLYAKVVDAYGCLGVLQLNAGESSVLYLVLVTGCVSVGRIGDTEIFRITQTHFVSLQHQQPSEDRIGEVRKVLNSGTFYFSSTSTPSGGGPTTSTGQPPSSFDLTLCAQRRPYTSEPDNRFFWNRMMFTHPLRFGVDTGFWLLRCMCGSVEVRTVYAGSRQARAAILSRLSCERAGTRFNVRGTNDDGHVANFVETEQVIFVDGVVTSYVQTRGSVPLFWEQPGVQVGSHKVRLSRGFEASQPAFERHMAQMRERYGGHAIVNLLGTSLIGSKEGEAMLSQEFQRQHRESSAADDVPHIVFDYHQECRGGLTALGKLKARLQAHRGHNWFEVFHASGDMVYLQQTGTIRTNCLDCLDRTNCVQTFLGLEVLGEQVRALGLSDKKQTVSRFEEVFRQMWVNNGNEVSKIYAGTGAIQGGSKLMDGARSAARTIQNNLLDNSKQEAIDILLVGSTLNSELADRARILLPTNMLHAPTPVLREMCKRYTEYVEAQEIRVSVGTYNVNGGKHFRSVVFKDLSLTDWLLDAHHPSGSLVDVTSSGTGTGSTAASPTSAKSSSSASTPVPNDVEPASDIIAVGFQEIVDLNASNIMAASTDNARAWADELGRTLNRDRPYALLTYQQLVGVCLYVFVRPQHLPYVRDVAVDCVKTGLGGTTGNKGASAIRFVLYGTSMCFVAAHFAAGQSQVAERNADYGEITRKIAFPMGRSLKSHDYVFWCGDFNYRIDMDKDELREQLQQQQHLQQQPDGTLATIFELDQLRKQQLAGAVFADFQEGPVHFQPTYKYDLFSDDYDTSEKQRAPAWTDRVLWRRRPTHPDADRTPGWNNGRLRHYGRAELKQSDHRPVIAIVDIELAQIDTARRERVFHEVIADLGPPDATVVIRAGLRNGDTDDAPSIYDEDLMAALIEELSHIGEITLVRYVGEAMWVTFRDGQSALAADRKRETHIGGVRLLFRLKTDNWMDQVQHEIGLCTTNTVSMCPDMEASTAAAAAAAVDYNCLGIPKMPPARPKSPRASGSGPPARPPLPGKSPTPVSSPMHTVAAAAASTAAHVDPQLIQRMSRPMVTPMVPIMVAAPPVLASPSVAPLQGGGGAYADEEPNAIYEEINDDINIPEPREPPPPPPSATTHTSSSSSGASHLYDLDVNEPAPPPPSSSSSPSHNTSPKQQQQQQQHSPPTPTGTTPPTQAPPPLPVRRGAPPPVPNRSGAPPPLPARPNAP